MSLLMILAFIMIRLLRSYEIKELGEKFGFSQFLLVIVDHLKLYLFFIIELYKSHYDFQWVV